jgi:hypothetical protein
MTNLSKTLSVGLLLLAGCATPLFNTPPVGPTADPTVGWPTPEYEIILNPDLHMSIPDGLPAAIAAGVADALEGSVAYTAGTVTGATGSSDLGTTVGGALAALIAGALGLGVRKASKEVARVNKKLAEWEEEA